MTEISIVLSNIKAELKNNFTYMQKGLLDLKASISEFKKLLRQYHYF